MKQLQAPTITLHRSIARALRSGALAAGFGLSLSAAALAQTVGAAGFDIPEQPLSTALKAFAEQAGMQLLYRPEAVSGAVARPVHGRLDKRQALQQMLQGTGLEVVYSADDAATIRPRKKEPASKEDSTSSATTAASVPARESRQAARADAGEGRRPPDAPGTQGARIQDLPEILVMGSRTLNMDIRRTPDDVQPYVVFDREKIERSGAVNLDDFLRSRLSMSASASRAQQPGEDGSFSAINLRGLGTAQTLILIDGHRIASRMSGGVPQQPDINMIPLSSIERIEVLPTTASGIHGGGATGGVINIVLRRDYEGLEAQVAYGGSFHGGAIRRRLDVTGGFGLGNGRTRVMLAASHAETGDLLVADRDFLSRGRAAILRNNPGAFTNANAPPLGATTNIKGVVFDPACFCYAVAPLSLKPEYGGTALGSAFTFIPDGYAGASAAGAVALVANAGRYNLDPADTAQRGGGGLQSLLNAPTVKSATVTVRHDFSARLHGFLELGGSENSGRFRQNAASSTFRIPAAAVHNPFAQDIYVTTPAFGADRFIDSSQSASRALGGLIYQLGGEWQAEADYTWQRTRFQSTSPSDLTAEAAAAVAGGSLDVLRDTRLHPVDFGPFLDQRTVAKPVENTLRDVALRFSGPLGNLPGGRPTLSLLLEHSEEAAGRSEIITPGFTVLAPRISQSVDSLYLETRLPLLSPRNAIPGVYDLELQLAGRHDRYRIRTGNQVFSYDPQPFVFVSRELSSTNPTLGLRYQPFPDLTVRASHGTGFMPPNVAQLAPVAPPVVFPAFLGVTDPLRGDEPLPDFLYYTGGNPNLSPEESRSWSAGLVFTPRIIQGLRASVDWTRIEKSGEIRVLGLSALRYGESIPGLVVRGPVPPGDPYGVGRVLEFHDIFHNTANSRVEALDLALDYSRNTDRAGRFTVYAAATRQLHHETRLVSALPLLDNAGFTEDLKWKGNASLVWDYGALSVGWTAIHFSSYQVGSFGNADPETVANQGSGRIPSQTYHDVFASYRIGEAASGVWSNLDIQLNLRNVFDRSPPPLLSGVSTGGFLYSTLGSPELARYEISIRKRF